MNCPKCQAEMETVRAPGLDVDVDRCTACGGLWFDNLEHVKLKSHGLEGIDTGEPAPENSSAATARDPVDCPRCQRGTIRMVDARQTHIEFEKCPTCSGVFFDAGEFRDYVHETPADFIRDLLARHRD